MRVVAFDLGNTLLEYAGVPLSWEAHYDDALAKLAAHLRTQPTSGQMARARDVLCRFNTRLNPRSHEIPFATILAELAAGFGAEPGAELAAATAFFQVFQQRLRVFPETLPTLATLRQEGVRIGVFTDVPYGMPRELVLNDVAEAGLAGALDALVTSRDAGFRKPAPETMQAIAAALKCGARDLSYVGDERKDIEAARACGCRAILLDRGGTSAQWGQDETIRTLADLLRPR